ncbi:MAG: FecR domain-containing protein [Dysgonamonadaceae bacterium]|jgi:ferric-dicitrate binding protein FerR (iron transport regulator)|nr:FecR domain-containing protein [Dysgonamonadaceae bacterium]
MEDHSTDNRLDYLPEEVALRHSLLKKNVKQPDVKKELARFHREHRTERPRRSVIVILSALTGAVAALLLVFLIRKTEVNDARQDRPVTVYHADNTSTEVTLQDNSGATLTLDSNRESIDTLLGRYGAVVNIETNTLCYQGQTEAGEKEVRMQTLTTPRKKEFKVILADGTEVWLNAESQLSYPAVFKGDRRTIFLQGEAYFKVTADEQHPFLVQTENMQTTVLGTEFNVRCYSVNDTHVTLVQGSVEVADTQGAHTVKIIPGQNALLKSDGSFDVRNVDLATYIEWKNGYFYFDEKPLIEVLCELGRWYNVEIVLARQNIGDLKVHFAADRRESLEEAIHLLNSFRKFKVRKEDQKLIVE